MHLSPLPRWVVPQYRSAQYCAPPSRTSSDDLLLQHPHGHILSGAPRPRRGATRGPSLFPPYPATTPGEASGRAVQYRAVQYVLESHHFRPCCSNWPRVVAPGCSQLRTTHQAATSRNGSAQLPFFPLILIPPPSVSYLTLRPHDGALLLLQRLVHLGAEKDRVQNMIHKQ